MSFLVGPVSGALVAGGVYYGFSNLITTRTQQHRQDLRSLSVRLVEQPSHVQAPPSAATRISDRQFSSLLRAKWNQEIAYLFTGVHSWDVRALEWGRRLLYGNDTTPTPTRREQS